MKKHVAYLDYLRSYAMIMVVLLHCIGFFITEEKNFGTTSWYINLVVNAFSRTAVPIFLMISGYLMLSSEGASDMRGFYKKRLGRIVIPLVFWNVIYYIFDVIKNNSTLSFASFFNGFFSTGTYYHLWYLYMLGVLYLLTPFIKCITDRCSIRQLTLLVVILFSSSTIFPILNTVFSLHIRLFDALCNGYIPCYILGYILAKADFGKGDTLFFGIFAFVCLFLSVVINHANSSAGYINLVTNSGYSFCHIGMAASAFVIFRFFATRANRTVQFVAKYSFGVYLVHIIVLEVIMEFFCIDASPIVTSLYLFAVTTVLSLLISFVIMKIKYLNKVIS